MSSSSSTCSRVGRQRDRVLVGVLLLGELEEDDGDVVLAAAAVRRARRAPSPRPRGRRGCSSTTLEDRVVVDHRRQAVRAEQEEVARLGRRRERVDVDVRVGAEGARDHGALRVRLGLLGREPAAADELGDERVVLGQLLELAVADAGTRASRRRGRSRRVPSLDERDGHRRAHPGGGRVARRRARRRGGSPPGSASTTRSSPRRRRRSSSSAAAASRDATSPACAPPIPSATAKSGGSQTYASSLCRRLRPGSVAAACARASCARTSAPSRRCGRRRRASSRCGCVDRIAVHERAVRRADVLDPDAVAARLDARVARRRELVARRARRRSPRRGRA